MAEVEAEDSGEESRCLRQVSDLIVEGAGGRRIFRLLVPDVCRHACDFCPARSQRFLPVAWRKPPRLLKIFMLAFRRGWCDGLFLMAGVARSPAFAMERLLEMVETLRFTYGYRGYLHVKAPEGAQAGQIERLMRLVDRVSYRLDPACERAEGASPSHVLPIDGKRPFDPDPKLRWALDHAEKFPVELSTASPYELARVPGVGPRAAERIVSARDRGELRDTQDLLRLGAAQRARRFLMLRGKPLAENRRQQPLLFEGLSHFSTISSPGRGGRISRDQRPPL